MTLVNKDGGIGGILPILQGGTGSATANGAMQNISPLTTKGDIIVHGSTDPNRLPIDATDGYVLTVNSAAFNGVEWASSAGSGEANTGLNVGGGIGIFHTKIDEELQFKSLSAGSSKLTVVLGAFVVTLDVDETAIVHDNLIGGTTGSPHAAHATLVTGVVPTAELGSGTPDGTKFLRDDQTWQTPASGEVNTASNVGSGGVVFKTKSGVDFEFYSLVSTPGHILFTPGANELNLTVVASSLLLQNFDGVVPLAKGGTGFIAKTAAFNALAPTTTKGDLIVHNGSNNVRQAVGENGKGLTPDSTIASGVKWVSFGAQLGGSGLSIIVPKTTTTNHSPINLVEDATEANIQFYVTRPGVIENLYIYVSVNDTGADGNTVTVRLNGSNQTLQVTYDTGETGSHVDTTNKFSVVVGDKISVQISNLGSGGGAKDLTVESITMEFGQ